MQPLMELPEEDRSRFPGPQTVLSLTLEPERRQQVTPRDEDGGRHGGGADGGEAPPAEKRRGVRRGGHAVSSVPYRTRRRFAGGLSASAPPLLCDGILPMSAAQ